MKCLAHQERFYIFLVERQILQCHQHLVYFETETMCLIKTFLVLELVKGRFNVVVVFPVYVFRKQF